jgi:hypothetical protein
MMNAGWLLLENARAAHFFGTDGRSLCHKWAYFGLDRYEVPGKCPTCKECLRLLQKRVAKKK